MKKALVLSVALFMANSLVLGACGTKPTSPAVSNSASAPEAPQSKLKYEIVVDKKFEKTEQREVRVTTEETDYEAITKQIKDKYKAQKLDSLHLYIHTPDSKKSYGTLKAHSFVAFTQKGAAQVGLTKEDSYKIELEKEASTKQKEDQTSKEWQDSFKQISLSQAQTYVELTEKNGNLPTNRLEEYSKVVKQQADKIVDSTLKEKLTRLSSLIKENKLKEVKVLLDELK